MTTERPRVDGLTYSQVLARTAERFGARDALVSPQQGYRRDYRTLRAEVREVARALLSLGVQRGEHVAIWATNLPQWVLVQFATAHIGAVLVNINPAYRGYELQYVLEQADVTTLLLTDRFKSSSYFDLLAEVCPELATSPSGDVRSPACPKLRHVVSVQPRKRPGMLDWEEFLRRAANVSEAELDRREAEVRAEDVVNIQYTSGTTGFPKGAMLTHRNLLMNAYYVGQRLAFTDRDRLCIPVPFYHCFGCVMGTLMCAVHGSADGRARRVVRSAGHAAGDPGRALHRGLWRADHVHRRAESSALRASSTCAVCGPASWPAVPVRSRSCAPVVRAHGRPRHHHRLRADRGVAGHHADGNDRQPGASRRHGRHGAAGRRGAHRRAGTRGAAAAGTAGRIAGARPRHHEGLLQQAGRDRGRDHVRGLAAHRRPGAARRPTATTASPAGSRT